MYDKIINCFFYLNNNRNYDPNHLIRGFPRFSEDLLFNTNVQDSSFFKPELSAHLLISLTTERTAIAIITHTHMITQLDSPSDTDFLHSAYKTRALASSHQPQSIYYMHKSQ